MFHYIFLNIISHSFFYSILILSTAILLFHSFLLIKILYEKYYSTFFKTKILEYLELLNLRLLQIKSQKKKKEAIKKSFNYLIRI